jgi:hypothetical protein
MTQAKPFLLTIAIVGAGRFAFAVPVTHLAIGVTPIGQTDLVRDGDTTLQAAGYAFSI